MKPSHAPKRRRIATRQGRPAYFTPMIRERQPVTNAEWRARREAARRQNPLTRLIGKLLGRGVVNG